MTLADDRPPWAEGDQPRADSCTSLEAFVAGAISTVPPFNRYHPEWAIPIAKQALVAVSEWDPDD